MYNIAATLKQKPHTTIYISRPDDRLRQQTAGANVRRRSWFPWRLFFGLFGAFTTLAVVLGTIRVVHAHDLLTGNHSMQSTQKYISQPAIRPAPVDNDELAQSINSTIAQNSNLEIGVSLVSVADGKTANFGVSDPYVAGSVDKLMTASLFFHEVDDKQASLGQVLEDNDNAQDDLQKMVVLSDNDAWQSLNDYLTHDALRAYANSVGVRSYDPDNNTIAPEDIAQLLYKIYDKKLLSPASTTQLLSYMKQANYTQFIMAAIPNGVKAYHKVGYLDDRLNDVAIIDNGKTPYVLVIFSKTADNSQYDFGGQGQQLFQSLTKTTINDLL